MAQSYRILLTLFALAAAATTTNAFTTPSQNIVTSNRASMSPHLMKPASFSNPNVIESKNSESKTMLMERRWNFNEARGPFGMKKNAEIWNGRAAQVSQVFFVVYSLLNEMRHSAIYL